MENISVIIPEIQLEKDFTIVYKGKESKGNTKECIVEIQTSRDDLLMKLRYFKPKSNEIKYLSEYYIHDEFDVTIFQSFIDSIRTHKIDLNDNNYIEYYRLSVKYEYHEMTQIIAQFIENRPDLQKIIEKFSSNQQRETNDSIVEIEKEKIISKNLDFFLKHGNLFKLPIQAVNRILNSQDRVLNDHHLLFQFIKKMISESNEQNSKEINEEMKENFEILISALDCNEMTNDEILELLEITKSFCHFNLRNSNERIKTILEIDKEKDIKISKLEEEITNNKEEIKQLNQRIDSFERKFEEQSKLLIQFQQELSNFVSHQNFEELKNKYGIIESNQKKIKDKIEQLEQIHKKSQTKHIIENCTDGVIQNLTKICGGNVADKGVVKVTASSFYGNGNEYPLKSVVDIDEKKTSFVSGDKPNSWIKYDFIDKKIRPTHYLIRSAHNNDRGINNMLSWVCEGSNTDEENDWKILDSRNDVSYLNDAGAFHKFEIQISLQPNECYRYIRIRQTKPNASNGNYLVISALEYYGSIIL